MKDVHMLKTVEFDKYFKTDSWEEANKSFFNQLAPKYDRLNEIISLGQQQRYKADAIAVLKLEQGMRVLDVCTGSGDMALGMRESCDGLHIDAVDAASAMLIIAKDKARRLEARNVYFYEASALELPFKDNTFDAIMMSFGLRNLKDMSLGLKEMYRVLKPGGTFTTLDLGKPEGHWQKALYHIYYERLMPWLGKVVFHRNEYNSFAYLSISNKYFPSSKEVMGMMAGAGFRNIYDKKYMLGGVAQQVGEK
ncbi:MAG: ubiquinone/menaquinone biosynthesis methyltransferase [Candidatus Omnitrophica bacterium]|nr:ubiquinone/menaquinone biosynthesis methyltransferase [Candidatus Omnitrophota bacterium]